MAKPTLEIITQVLLKEGYLKQVDGTFTHPYEQELENSLLERIGRNLRLPGRPGR
jgi:hypothetical protein